MSPLQAVPALRGLPAGALRSLADRSRPVRVAAGAVLRPAGPPARSVMFLLGGTVAATHDTADGAGMWPEQWTGPAIVDKAAVLAGGPTATGLVAVTAVEAWRLDRARFLRLLDDEPSVRSHVLTRLAQDALTARHRLARAATQPATVRVAAWLAEQDEPWPGSQEHLARLLGLSRVTVNRALGRLTRAGLVRRTPGGLVVSGPEPGGRGGADPWS